MQFRLSRSTTTITAEESWQLFPYPRNSCGKRSNRILCCGSVVPRKPLGMRPSPPVIVNQLPRVISPVGQYRESFSDIRLSAILPDSVLNQNFKVHWPRSAPGSRCTRDSPSGSPSSTMALTIWIVAGAANGGEAVSFFSPAARFPQVSARQRSRVDGS